MCFWPGDVDGTLKTPAVQARDMKALSFFGCIIRKSLLSSATFDSFVSIELILEFTAKKACTSWNWDFLERLELTKRQHQKHQQRERMELSCREQRRG